MSANPNLTRLGTPGLPRIGAVAISASIRVSGHKKAAKRVLNSAVVMLIMDEFFGALAGWCR